MDVTQLEITTDLALVITKLPGNLKKETTSFCSSKIGLFRKGEGPSLEILLAQVDLDIFLLIQLGNSRRYKNLL